MAGEKRKADMVISVTDELSETYGGEGAGEGAGEIEGAGAGAGAGEGERFGYGDEDEDGDGDEDEQEIKQEEERAKSTYQKDKKLSIMDENPADWESWSKERQVTESWVSRNAVREGLNAAKHQKKQGHVGPEMEAKRSTKKAKMDPENTRSYGYSHQGLTSVPTKSRSQHPPHSQRRQPYRPGGFTSINAGPSRTTPAYERCMRCGTSSLPAENPSWERHCKDCRELLLPSQPLAHGTQAYVQSIVSPYAPLPATHPFGPPILLSQPGPPPPAPLAPRGAPLAAPVPAYTGGISYDDEDRMTNEFGQLIDVAGEVVDFYGYLIDPVTGGRKLDVYGREMWGRRK